MKSVLLSMESSQYYPRLAVEAARADGYSVVMTTSLDSDASVQYFSYIEYDLFRPPKPKSAQAIAVAVISNCGANSFRMEAIERLEAAGVTIDKFGGCFRNRFQEDKIELLSKYKFYLAFENSIEEDYVTEKYLHALVAGSVPVVIGAPNIMAYAPNNNSILYIPSINHVDNVARRMLQLGNNQTEYDAMFSWKDKPSREWLALFDMGAVHCIHRLCGLIATRQIINHVSAQNHSQCHCRDDGTGAEWRRVWVRERGRFVDFVPVTIPASADDIQLRKSILKEFRKQSHVPIWLGERSLGLRKDFLGTAKSLDLYTVYPVGVTQRKALFGDAAIDSQQKLRNLFAAQKCPLLEVIFI